MRHTENGNRNQLNRSRTNYAKQTETIHDPPKPEPDIRSSKTRAERTSVGRVINGWKVIAKVRKSEVGKIPHPIYRGICPVCGCEKDQELAYFRNSKSCGCAQYKRSNQPENLEDDMDDMDDMEDMEESYNPRPSRRKQGSRKPGVLVKYADMPENQQIMLSECLGQTWNAVQNIAGDRFLLMLDAFQGDDVQMPTVEQIEKRIIMAKIASEFKRLRAYSDEDQSIDPIIDEMAETHKTSPNTIMEILRLASIELQNADSEHAFHMYGESADHVLG